MSAPKWKWRYDNERTVWTADSLLGNGETIDVYITERGEFQAQDRDGNNIGVPRLSLAAAQMTAVRQDAIDYIEAEDE